MPSGPPAPDSGEDTELSSKSKSSNWVVSCGLEDDFFALFLAEFAFVSDGATKRPLIMASMSSSSASSSVRLPGPPPDLPKPGPREVMSLSALRSPIIEPDAPPRDLMEGTPFKEAKPDMLMNVKRL